jgi:hypothetical protein
MSDGIKLQNFLAKVFFFLCCAITESDVNDVE